MEDFKKFSLLKHHETIATDNTMEQKHTPGPWNVEFGSGSMPYIIVTPAKVWIGATKYIGDAQLFARAPELLEQVSALTKENEYLKQLLKRAADMLPAYVGPPEKPEINKPSEELYYLIQDAIKSLLSKFPEVPNE